MIEMFSPFPRLIVCALAGVAVGLLGAFALHSLAPTAPTEFLMLVFLVGLGVGVVLGAKWEARKS